MEIHAGELRHRLVIERLAGDAQGVNGERIPAYQTVATRWGSIETLDATERMIAKQAQTLASHRITMRWVDGLSTKDRLKFGDRVFEISSIANAAELNYALEIIAWELQS